jgi:hypothetical protein
MNAIIMGAAPLSPTNVNNAITNALIQGGQQWLILTIVAFLPAIWTVTLMFHFGRPYMIRTLRKCGLRFGADVWWMSYVLIRDGVMVLLFCLSIIFFLPNLVDTMPLPITAPISAIFLLWALLIKLLRPVDDDPKAYQLSSVFLVLGATLYYIPQVFAVEANSQVHLAGLVNTLQSGSNVAWANGIMYTSLSLLVLTGAFIFFFVLGKVNRAAIAGRRPRRGLPAELRQPVEARS